ncbi:hypothetical protein ZWY2020_040270 [Hordeum vulgare]|nr:hypothetical protein ZWY2020_040270 [Hordeum vulgare]
MSAATTTPPDVPASAAAVASDAAPAPPLSVAPTTCIWMTSPGHATRARSVPTTSPLWLVGPPPMMPGVRSRVQRCPGRSASSGHGLAYAGPAVPAVHISPLQKRRTKRSNLHCLRSLGR